MQVVALSDLHGIRSRFEKARRLLDQGIDMLLRGVAVGPGNDPAVLNGVLIDVASRSLRRIML